MADYEKRIVRNVTRCLECGDKISYGRTDKKFCSEDCKNRHHNHKANHSRSIRRKIMACLEKNYDVLDRLLESGVGSVALPEIMMLGFNPVYATSMHRDRQTCRYSCFDISYIMTASRITSISKIQNLSLNLQAGQFCNDH